MRRLIERPPGALWDVALTSSAANPSAEHHREHEGEADHQHDTHDESVSHHDDKQDAEQDFDGEEALLELAAQSSRQPTK